MHFGGPFHVCFFGQQKGHAAVDARIETGAGSISENSPMGKAHMLATLLGHFERLPVQSCGNLPFGIGLSRARCKIEREGAAFGAEPEALFAAHRIELRPYGAGCDQRTVEPAEAASAPPGRCRSHHASLPGRDETHPRFACRIGQFDRSDGVDGQKIEVSRVVVHGKKSPNEKKIGKNLLVKTF